MPTVGYATLQIIPSVRGISDELRRQLVGPAGDAGGRAGQSAGGGFREAFTGALAAIGITQVASKLGGQFTDAFTQALGQSSVTNTLQAQLDTSNKVAAQQGKLAGKLYGSGVADSFESAADAIKSVMQAGLAPSGATTKQLEALATKASDVANVFDQDLGGVTNAVSQMLRTGLAKNADQAFDLITKGFQGGTDKAGDFLDTINEYGTQFRKAGLDGQTAIGLLNQAIQGGARDADVAADSLKEFAIRAVDGSATTADGFKMLGLNADQMAARFAKGGSSATAVLDLTLDRLRGIKDPVKQSQAAVNLFGTQAEDLGQALLTMDPTTAAKGLGDVGGAAKKVGDTIRTGPSHEITVFTRSLKQGLVDFIGGKVLPVVTTLGSGFNTYLLPPISTVGSVVAATLIPALTGLWSAGAAVVDWAREWGVWLVPLAIAIGGVTLALNAQAIATAFVTGVFSVYRAAILVGTAITNGFAVAQATLNAVMALNPFVLIAIAVVALGAALFIAWKKSETFRDIVMGAWKGIQTAALWAWTNVLKPVVDGLVAGWKMVAAGALWLWNTVLAPVFSFISTAARIVATIYATVFLVAFKVWWTGVRLYFGLVMTAVRAVGSFFSWLWTNAISPVLGWIVAGFKLWWAGVKLYFSLVMSGVRALGAVAMWLWTNAFRPVVNWIVAGAKLLWAGVKVVFGYFTAGIKTLASWANWLWKNAISPAFNGAKSTISTVWNTGIKPVFDKLKSAVGLVGAAFGTAKDAIKLAWDKVKDITRKPIQFVVDTVYNRGIVGVWNKVADAFGAPKLDTFKFASGGVLPGYTPGRDVHLAALSGGEAIMRPEWTRAVGPGYVHAMNAAARGGGVRGVQRALGLPGFADGGIFGWIGKAASAPVDLAKSGVKWLKDGIKDSALAGLNSIVKPLIDKISGSASLYRDMITGVPKRMIKAILGYADKADGKMEAAGIGGKGFKAALSWARTQNGKPYQWGGNGDPSWDCSGFMSAIESVIRGEKPHRRWATGAFSGASAPSGWVRGARSPFMIGITNAGVGHTAGTINGINVESRGGDGVVVGSRARSYRDSLFTDIYGFKGYAGGGRPKPGEVFWVGERGPELMQLGSGGATVWDSATSMRMAAGLGRLRGFAKGTSSATARKQVPGDLTGFTKSLTGSASSIAKAAKELAKDLRAAGGSGKVLAVRVTAASATLQAMAKQRDSVASRLATARQAATDQKKAAADYLGLSNVGDVTSVGDLISGMRQRQASVKGFQSSIKTLSKKGLSEDLIRQMVGMGPDSQLAQLVAGANASQIKQLNALASSGAKLSASYGNSMADAMYDAGKNASRGFLTGLQSQDKELQAAMNRLGDGLVKSIKKKLKIRSPSRVTMPLGAHTGQGFAIGLDSTASRVAAAAARVSQAAVPVVPDVATRAAMAGGIGLRPGDQLRLVVDGHEFAAYVDTRADGRVSAGQQQLVRVINAS